MKKFTSSLSRWWLINSSRVYLRKCNEVFSKEISSDSYVLDAGAGTAPYKDLFSHAHYETADFEKVDKAYSPSTYTCNLSSIPVENERFDHIIFNQVMEHLPEPSIVLSEFYRILKPGGTIICTCPLFFEEHEQPYDFYRYTQFAHTHLFEKAHFSIQSIEWMEGYFGTLAYQLQSAYRHLPVNPKHYPMGILGWLVAPVLFLIKCISFVFAGLLYRLDLRYKYTRSGLPKNYIVIASKPPKRP